MRGLSTNWIRFSIYLGALVCAVLLILQGVRLEAPWLRAVSVAVGVVVAVVWILDRYAWRWRGVRSVLRRRLVRGTWRGELTSDWTDPRTGRKRGPITVHLVVEQTYSEATASLLTPESKSQSIAATLDDPARGQCLLTAIYMNTPELLLQGRSPVHRGGMVLEVCGRPPDRLEGSYWTDRGTRGQLVFDVRSPKLHDSYGAADSDTYV